MMRVFLSLPVAIFVAAFLSSCADITVLRYESTARPPKSLDTPITILDKATITRPYKVIGLIKIDASTQHFSVEIIEQIKMEARKLGGDAVIDLQQQPLESSLPIGSFPTGQADLTYSGHLRDLWSAKVIVWQTP
jgi:hypothetical protein